MFIRWDGFMSEEKGRLRKASNLWYGVNPKVSHNRVLRVSNGSTDGGQEMRSRSWADTSSVSTATQW